jgi:SpoVK/Ycf46/Vps4 family AAA+-type ATPase
MSTRSQSNVDPEGTPLVSYAPKTFAEHLARLMDTEEDRTGTRLLFHGGVREQRQQALGTLTRYATGNIHQFQVPSLLSTYRMQTQNNLRKAFDHAAEESALLYFDKADPLFSHSHDDAPDVDPEAVPSTLEYFFDRVGAYAGLVVLGLQRKRHAEWAHDKVHLVVQFE